MTKENENFSLKVTSYHVMQTNIKYKTKHKLKENYQ